MTGSMNAEIRGNGGGDGKCTIEVQVDETADVEISGTRAVIRTISGNPASMKRFQCNQAMPTYPGNFRFEGVDGRGSQTLVRPPSNGPAVVRIQDSKGGSEGYTFDIFWNGGTDTGGFGQTNSGPYNRNNRRGGGGWTGDSTGGGWTNDGWGSGSGWNNNNAVSFQGGRRGAGSFTDREGRTRRLDNARVSIDNSGAVAVSFDGEAGTLDLRGQVTRREGRRVIAQMEGSGMRGQMELEMTQRDRVRRISIPDIGLNWAN